MCIDKLGEFIEKLIERVKGLKFKFRDGSNEEDALETQREIVSSLEAYLEIAEEDSQIEGEEDKD